jgi:hypothetical protein
VNRRVTDEDSEQDTLTSRAPKPLLLDLVRVMVRKLSAVKRHNQGKGKRDLEANGIP